GPQEGWVYKTFPQFGAIGNAWHPVGSRAIPGEVAGLTAVLQDNRGDTPETYRVGLFRPDARGEAPCPPDAATTLLTSGPISTPASAATGVVTWRTTFTLAGGPLFVLPAPGTVFQGLYLSTSPYWPADGLAWPCSLYNPGVGPGDHPHPDAPNYTVSCNVTLGNLLVDPGGGAFDRNPHGGILTTRPVFEVGSGFVAPFEYGVAGH